MLGYSLSMKLLNFLSQLFKLQFLTMSMNGILKFQLSVVGLFGLIPILAYLLFKYEFGDKSDNEPIFKYWRNAGLLLLASLIGVVGDVFTFKLMHNQVEELSEDGEMWTSYLEQLKSFTVGLGMMLVVSLALYLWIKGRRESIDSPTE
jgi:hypothetical protein